jgi:HSP20 family protein
MYETEDSIIVRVELAGMRDNDFEVAIENHILVITGSRPDVSERRAYHQMEIWFGKFEIAIDIPIPIHVESSVADYQDGFLTVNLSKAKSKQDGVGK